jgi:hypothetical protein
MVPSAGSVSRRAVLGATVLAPALGGAGALILGNVPAAIAGTGEWAHALVGFLAAETALAVAAAVPNEGAYGCAIQPFQQALLRLLKTPAPDLAAFALKMERVARHQETLRGSSGVIFQLRRDARLLLT